jgi:hypothetical protein
MTVADVILGYDDYVRRKLALVIREGLSAKPKECGLFDHQRVLVEWALRRGSAAIFADTGLGKSRMQLAWADTVHRETGGDVLILAPLAVAAQTVSEGAEIGVEVTHCREAEDVRPGVNIINYDRLHKLDCSRFAGVVLDESSVIKHQNSRTFQSLTEAFRLTPYKLCATATPAPNDWTELGTHAEFLGICSRAEMLAEYFCHDGGETQVWQLKGHARHLFWQWVATWGAMIRKPSDLGFDDGRYNLPPLHVHQHTVESCMETANEAGFLFPMEAGDLSARRDARRQSIDGRVEAAAALVNSNDRSWIVWCDLNAEGDALRKAIPGAVEIRGSDDADVKEQRLIDFAAGKIRVLITKPSIAGWGLNWQHCRDVAFVGVTDSYEAYYQAVRRCWRFGQTKPVNVHVIASESEGSVVANIRRKEAIADAMAKELSAETNEAVRSEVLGAQRDTNTYNNSRAMAVPAWLQTEAA